MARKLNTYLDSRDPIWRTTLYSTPFDMTNKKQDRFQQSNRVNLLNISCLRNHSVISREKLVKLTRHRIDVVVNKTWMRYGCQDISIFKGGYNFYQQQWTCMPLLLVNWSGIFHDALFVGIFEGKSDGMEKVVCCKVFQGNTKQQFLRCSFLMASFFMVTRRWCAHHSSCATSVSQWIMLLCYDNDATLIHTRVFSPKRLKCNLIKWY